MKEASWRGTDPYIRAMIAVRVRREGRKEGRIIITYAAGTPRYVRAREGLSWQRRLYIVMTEYGRLRVTRTGPA